MSDPHAKMGVRIDKSRSGPSSSWPTARHSPVSKILTNEIKLETRLVAARGASAGAETGSATPVAST